MLTFLMPLAACCLQHAAVMLRAGAMQATPAANIRHTVGSMLSATCRRLAALDVDDMIL